ncbi:PPE domain-containing protein [Mycobacterium palustre]|nr:PPE domain-containing protein [Mycobacterium palustre]
MPDFSLLPPEINSALIYAGAGAGPLFAAATAWDGLATDLWASASSFGAVISALAEGPWTGPASEAMAGAAAPYASWLASSAALCRGRASRSLVIGAAKSVRRLGGS